MIKPKGTGFCYCGCGASTSTFFVAGHDKRSEAMLNKLLYGPDTNIAARLIAEGYGPGAKNLFVEHEALEARVAAAVAKVHAAGRRTR